jgi:hypothetical protein
VSGMFDFAAENLAVIRREIPMRLIDFSASGCLIEAAVPLAAGSACELRVEIYGETYADAIRVTRCVAVSGASSGFRVGAAFLCAVPGPKSLQSALAALQPTLR